jgi:hypothetical protein
MYHVLSLAAFPAIKNRNYVIFGKTDKILTELFYQLSGLTRRFSNNYTIF